MAKNYINNRDFSNSVDEWLDRKANDNTARMSDYLGTCILTLVNRYASRYNFSGYTYLDDMKTEALYLSVRYAHNYNSAKAYGNAFGYFSKIVENAFRCIIKKEKHIAEGKFNHIKYLCDIEGYDYKNYENMTDIENASKYSNQGMVCPICNFKIPLAQSSIEKHLTKHPQIYPELVYPLSMMLENKRGCNDVMKVLNEDQQVYIKTFIKDCKKIDISEGSDATI